MILSTSARALLDSDGNSWTKMTLDTSQCIQKVLWYRNSGYVHRTWTCTKDDCSNCVGSSCSYYTLTVSNEVAVSGLPSFSDCRYGDTVEIRRIVDTNQYGFKVYEVAIIKKEGNMILFYTVK